MKQSLTVAALALGAMLAGGCATKTYVTKSIDPVNGRVDQVSQQQTQQGQKLDQTAANLQKDETELSATKERAMTADAKAGDALNRADQAGQKADQASQKADLASHRADQVSKELKDTVANLDDYKPVGQATVNFRFNSDKLDSDAKPQLDRMATGQSQYKRFFVAVEGFTDSTGPSDYNNALSRRRADAVVQYLVAQHNIPVYRIHTVGLGKEKPLDDAKNRTARARNRRVEVTLFSADQGAVAMNEGPNPASRDAARSGNSTAQP
jgi:OmpA-OmpF porin, OOP family